MQRKPATRSQSVDDQITHTPYSPDQIAMFHRQLRSGKEKVFVYLHDLSPSASRTRLPDQDSSLLGDSRRQENADQGATAATTDQAPSLGEDWDVNDNNGDQLNNGLQDAQEQKERDADALDDNQYLVFN